MCKSNVMAGVLVLLAFAVCADSKALAYRHFVCTAALKDQTKRGSENTIELFAAPDGEVKRRLSIGQLNERYSIELRLFSSDWFAFRDLESQEVFWVRPDQVVCSIRGQGF